MRAKRKNLGREQRGASLVELALVLPLFMVMLVGIVDFGRAFTDFIIITNASREGARYASHFPSDEQGIITATREAVGGSGINPADVIVTILELEAAPGYPIRVNVAYDFQMILGGFIGINHPLTLTASTEMVVFGTN